MSQQAVILDMDGVLINSYAAHLLAWQKSSAKRGLVMTEELFDRTFGQTNEDIIPQVAVRDLDPSSLAIWAEDKEAAYRAIITESFPAMDGASDLLERLHAAGFALAIGSSGPPENVACVLARLPGAEYFKAVVTGSDVQKGKPDPEVFLMAAERLGVEAASCAVIEDSLVGLRAARSAGMGAVGLTGTAPKEALARESDLVVDFLGELDPQNLAEVIAGSGPGKATG